MSCILPLPVSLKQLKNALFGSIFLTCFSLTAVNLKKGHDRSAVVSTTFHPVENFFWSLGNVANSGYFLLSDALCDRALQVLQHFVDCGADMSQATYCFFYAGTIRDSIEVSLLCAFYRIGEERPKSVVLLSWPIFGILQHLAQALQKSYFRHLLAEFLSSQTWEGYSTRPKLIAIGKGEIKDWSSCAKKVTPAEEQRILDLIISPIPRDAEGCLQKVETFQKDLDEFIEEALYSEGEPQDLTDYLLFEVGLSEVRPESLWCWLTIKWDKLSKRGPGPVWKFLTEEPERGDNENDLLELESGSLSG
jgi:hypothetical protein